MYSKTILYLFLSIIPVFCLFNQIASAYPVFESVQSYTSINKDSTLTLEKDHMYGMDDDIPIGILGCVYVDNNDRVYLCDQQQVIIHIYEADGVYLTSIGRQGKGPGEFLFLTRRTQITEDNQFIYITDGFFNDVHRAQVWHKESLSFAKTLALKADNREEYEELELYSIHNIYPLRRDSILVEYSPQVNNLQIDNARNYFMLHHEKGEILSGPQFNLKGNTYLTHHVEGRIPMNVNHSFPFFSRSLVVKNMEMLIVMPDTEKIQFNIINTYTGVVASLIVPHEKIPLNFQELQSYYKETDYMRALGEGVVEIMLNNAENIPEYWPAVKDMIADDQGNIWISTFTNDFETLKWIVVNQKGTITGTFLWPGSKKLMAVKKGYVYFKEKMDSAGQEALVRYAIK